MSSRKPKVSEQLLVEARDLKAGKVYFILDPDKPSWAFINKDSLEILKLCNGKNINQDMAERAAEAKILRLGLLIEVLECIGMKLDMHRGKRSSAVSVR